MPPTQPTNSTMLSPGLGIPRPGNSPGIGPSLSAKQNLGASGLSPVRHARRTKKMIVNHEIVHPKSLKPNPNENYYQWKNQSLNQQSSESTQRLHQPLSQKFGEDEPRMQPKGLNIKPIFQYGHQNFTHAGAKQPTRPPQPSHAHTLTKGQSQQFQRTTPEKGAS